MSHDRDWNKESDDQPYFTASNEIADKLMNISDSELRAELHRRAVATTRQEVWNRNKMWATNEINELKRRSERIANLKFDSVSFRPNTLIVTIEVSDKE